MSWISILMILICIVAAVIGYRRGFTKTVVSMLSFWLIIALVSVLNPMITEFVDEHTDLGKKTKEYCSEMMADHLENEEELGRNEQVGWIENLPLPEQIKEDLQENNNHVIYELLGATGFWDYIVSYLAQMLMRGVLLLISILVAWLIVKIVGTCINGIAEMPVISFFNRIAGFGIGAIKGLIFIWVLLLALTIVSGTEISVHILNQIQRDPYAYKVYCVNPFLWIMLHFMG